MILYKKIDPNHIFTYSKVVYDLLSNKIDLNNNKIV